MSKLGEKAKLNRLNKFFDEYFGRYHDIAEWWSNDDPCIWVFNIPSNDWARGTYYVTIDDSGLVTVMKKQYCNNYDEAMRGEYKYICSKRM